MFEYFDSVTINDIERVDIWKNFEISIVSTDYQIHKLTEGENLMSISNKYYNTINNWWVIYLFNNMNNINFSILYPETIQATIDKHKSDIINHSSLGSKRKAYITEVIRSYYNESYTLLESIKLTNTLLTFKSNSEIIKIADYIQSQLLIESYFNTNLKIPNISLVKEIKNKMSAFSKNWKLNK